MSRSKSVELTNLCMVYDEEGNVLVQEKNREGQKKYFFPGGHIEDGESIYESVIREVKEETGLSIKNLKFCGIKNFFTVEGFRYIVFLYKTKDYSGTIVNSSEGNIRWVEKSILTSDNTLWNLDLILEILEEKGPSELYYEPLEDGVVPKLI